MKPEPNSLGEIESPDMLADSPDVGGDLPDPLQIAVADLGEDEQS